MEASALHAPAGLARLPLGTPLLRLRSDDQLLALFRAGSEAAFGAIHDRYRQRLFAYVRQMLCNAPRQDAEDVLQDVFVRAYGSLRCDERAIHLRAWLYRVAHNRCIDHLRRPVPAAADVFEMSRKPLFDPIEEAQRREDLAQLVRDVGRLPEHQRSALLMRELDGMSYADLAGALDVTVPAVKSLLVRARIGLVEAAEARDADCTDIRADLAGSTDRGVKASARARRHMRTCDGCREYRMALRGIEKRFAALNPAAAGGSAAAAGGVATVSACKVAAVVCTAALATGGAVEVRHLTRDQPLAPAPAADKAVAPAAAQPARSVAAPPAPGYAASYPAKSAPVADRTEPRKVKREVQRKPAEAPVAAAPPVAAPQDAGAPVAEPNTSGGSQAPAADGDEPVQDTAPPPAADGGAVPAEPVDPAPAPADPAPAPADPGTGTPPAEH